MIFFGRHRRKYRAWEVKAIDTVYQAESDGIAKGVLSATVATDKIRAYTDGDNPPTTMRDANKGSSTGESGEIGVTLPVIKDDYWKITRTGAASVSVYWLPDK